MSTPKATAAVSSLAPYVPGKPLEELEREYGITDSIKLASNENPLGCGSRARAAMLQAIDVIGLYPDGSGFQLKQALARKHGCDPSCITLGNGSNDLLVLLAEAYLEPGAESVYSQYCFAIWPIAVQATGAMGKAAAARDYGHDPAAMLQLIGPQTRVVYVANPNNPTGTWLTGSDLERFIQGIPSRVLVVVDEAYVEYVTDARYRTAEQWLRQFPNLVVTRTFSKAYGLAGLRVGYALSAPEVADMLNRVRAPFNVNSIALAAAAAALEDEAHLRATAAMNTTGMQQVCAGLAALQVHCLPSQGNFVLADVGRPAGAVYESMLKQGVIVRPVGGYGLPRHLRITIGTKEQNTRMLTALERALAAPLNR
ncbi:MAG: histidinol-phosphate transaminase [Steroidobacteraceae bacterium]